ncbi:uncharacterized protein LOC114519253 [Dendronephthya gigantea]|uniref:uncharacterized protein LOC114519253 n=1 Tax=Dendronephthya gigantea TaxID=151771 RepID=UPI0010690D40|nr:uncharacterized protein LOC114519253 [Dendronephthya gigantea]
MVRNRDFSFRLLYRVAFFFFCLLFVCFYRGDRGFGLITGEIKTGSRKLREEFNDTPSTRKISNESIPDTTENSEQIDVDKTEEETGLQEIRKEIAVETKRSYEIGKKQEVPFSTSSLPKWKYPTMKPGIISHVNQTKWDIYIKINLSLLSRRFSHPDNFSTRQHNRNRRDIDAITRSKTGLIDCANSTFSIEYEDDYKVWNNFSIMYQGEIYHYDQYRVTKKGLEVCNSSKPLIQLRWQNLTIIEKEKMASRHCNVSVDGFPRQNYKVYKNLTVFFKLTTQSFTQRDYGVIFGHFAICAGKLNKACDEYLVRVKYGRQYHVWKNFSLSFNNRIYHPSEYRLNYDNIQMCASNDAKIQAIWKSRNSWKKVKARYECLAQGDHFIKTRVYVVNKQFTLYYQWRGQYLTRQDYRVKDGKPFVCKGRLRPESTEFTKEDLLTCNDSIINIKYDDEYKVWNNFSILYKNKVYDYTEYRVLNDTIKICNSTDDYVRNIWELRNYWMKRKRSFKGCNKAFGLNYYVVSKQLHVYWAAASQHFKTSDYGVIHGKPYLCQGKLGLQSREYTKEDQLTCNDSIINIKYDDKYKVWNNFSILYKNKVYDYTEYRVLNDTIKICNYTDDCLRNIWELRNNWVKRNRSFKGCNKNKAFRLNYYVVSKQLHVYWAAARQHFKTSDYGVIHGKPYVCKGNLTLLSTGYTKEDQLTCNDSIINIKYDDEYAVGKNFSLLYENKVYDYTEYRVLNDTIKICNSTDDYVRNIWKVRNEWMKKQIRSKNCRKHFIGKLLYFVTKHFHVYWAQVNQYLTRSEFAVIRGLPVICKEIVSHQIQRSRNFTKEDLLTCNDSIINIKYDDEYKVWNNFSVLYKNKVYDYTEYRVLNDTIKICNSTDNYVRNIWELRNNWVKRKRSFKGCNKAIRLNYYVVCKQLHVYWAAGSQHFKTSDYGVIHGKPYVCKGNLTLLSTGYTKEDQLTCNDSIINIKYEDEYKVWNNFSILYKNKVYDYTEYRVLNDTIKICNSTDDYVRNIWELRNNWVKRKRSFKGCNKAIRLNYYVVSKQLHVYWAAGSQHFKTSDNGVIHGKPYVCKGNLTILSTGYTKEDLLTCNDSIIDIKYDDEYKVWNNFSILYKSKVYDYTEYRVLNDCIKICKSTDDYVRNNWKLRNKWVKRVRFIKECNECSYLQYFVVSKQFHVYWARTDQYFSVNDYGVTDGRPCTCKKKFRPESLEFTKEDLLKCNDSIINIKYDDDYKGWSNLSILHKNKMYDYTEYRVLNDTIKICNSTDDYVRNIWKMRNEWIKREISFKGSQICVYLNYQAVVVSKQFHMYRSLTGQYFTKHDYGVIDGRPCISEEKYGPPSTEYTKEDLLTCSDSIINIKYDDEYKIWPNKNFAILYKYKVYDYTEYRVLNDTIKICNSTDDYVQNVWKMRTSWVKGFKYFESCIKSMRTNTDKRGHFTLLKDVKLEVVTVQYEISKTSSRNVTHRKKFNDLTEWVDVSFLRKSKTKYSYSVFEGKFTVCPGKRTEHSISDIRLFFIAPFCALALSIICLLLLLIVYGMLPELRTLPGLNLMSLSFSFLLALINYVVYLSLYLRVDKELDFPCARMEIINKFITYNILMNAAVNIYHLRKTFCRNTLVRSDVNKLKTFFKYSLFGWGVPVVITIVYIVLVKTKVLRFHQNITQESVSCAKDHNLPSWLVVVENYGVPGCVLFYIIAMFIFTARGIRKKLRASENIVQKSNIVKKRRSFVLLFKLSTTTAISWIPLVFEDLVFNSDLMISLLTVAWLSGVYVGIAFVFTGKNYQLLRKKFFGEQASR